MHARSTGSRGADTNVASNWWADFFEGLSTQLWLAVPWHERFDGAFCVGNSFRYLDAAGNAAFLRAVSAALKPGARFVLETPMILENLLDHLQDRPWWKVGEIYLLVSNQYDHTRSRLDIEYTFLSNGRAEVRRGSHQAYKYSELCELIEGAGFGRRDVCDPRGPMGLRGIAMHGAG